MTVNAISDTKKGRTGIAPTYLHTTPNVSFPGAKSPQMELSFVPWDIRFLELSFLGSERSKNFRSLELSFL